MQLNKEWSHLGNKEFINTRFKFCYIFTNSGEVIDKSWWNQGEELLYTCQETPMKSNFNRFPSRKRTKKGDLLLTRNATPYIFEPPINSIYSNVVQRVKILGNYDLKYIQYALRCAVNSQKVNGDTIPSWNMFVWDNLYLPLPPIDIQKRISEFLNKRTEIVDSYIQNLNNQISELRKYKLSYIEEALDSSSQKQKIKFKTIIRRKKTNRTDLEYFALEHIESNTGKLVPTDSVYSSAGGILCDKGDVCFGKLRPYLNKYYLVKTKCSCSSEIAVFKELDKTNYMYYLVQSPKFLQLCIAYSEGTKMPRINIEFIKNFKFSFPNKDEQTRIVKDIENKDAFIEKLINIKKDKISELINYKESMIYEYVTGKKEVA